MNLTDWFGKRGPEFIRKRAAALLNRYGLTAGKATDRIDHVMATFTQFGCSPSFPTPGSVVRRYSRFVHHLQALGAEIAVHSYDHIDLKAISIPKAVDQLVRGARAFEQCGVEYHGFRCPYLSCSDELLSALPKGLFEYSSNKAIEWITETVGDEEKTTRIFNTIQGFYAPRSSNDMVCVPWTQSGMVEIPVCVPDDLQLLDGLNLGPEGLTRVWGQILMQTHQRGELFNLIFHPELASFCENPFVSLLRKASQFHPPVWIARMRDISEWWREKSSFKVESLEIPTGLRLSFTCSPRATILVRGLGPCESGQAWNEGYYWLQSRVLDVPADPRPFVGLPVSASGPVVSFLQEQGYIVDIADTAARCAIYLDVATLDRMTQVQLVNHIETSPGPLVRYWRWPNGAKSALCITGDLDALTLLDYASRLFVR